MTTPVSLRTLLTIWLGLGVQSWGGGSATLLLIRREVVERRAWMDADEFTRAWAICQVAPGINLLGLTILIGWKLRRSAGAAVALFGLLFPSVTITILLTAGYALVRNSSIVAAALRGVVPATVGLGLLLSWQMAAPLLKQARWSGVADFVVSLGILIGSAGALVFWHPPVILVLIAGGAVGALWRMIRVRATA
jgi:chromate transporter